MASTTPFSSCAEPARRKARRIRRAYTLVEILIASSIFVVMVTMVMFAVVTQAKFGKSIGNYADMNESSRRALTRFEMDMRLASDVETMESRQVIISLFDTIKDWNATPPIVDAAKTVRYFCSGGNLYRQSPAVKDSAPDANCTVVLRDLDTDPKTKQAKCQFAYYDVDDKMTTGTLAVKKILLTGTMKRTFTGISNTDYLVSAVVVMRSKPGTRL